MVLKDRSEKEVMLASKEVRRQRRLHSQERFTLTARKLADFLDQPKRKRSASFSVCVTAKASRSDATAPSLLQVIPRIQRASWNVSLRTPHRCHQWSATPRRPRFMEISDDSRPVSDAGRF